MVFFSLSHELCQRNGVLQLGAKSDHLFDVERVGLSSLADLLDLTSTETDVGIVVVGFIKVEIGSDGSTFAVLTPALPMRIDGDRHGLEVGEILVGISRRPCRRVH